MRKKHKRVLKVSVLLAVLALCMQVTMPAFAYFQRGDVKIKAGKQSYLWNRAEVRASA